MNGSLLSIHLSDEQATELQNALCSRRDHYVELLNGPGTETSAARPEVERYWKGKVAGHPNADRLDQRFPLWGARECVDLCSHL